MSKSKASDFQWSITQHCCRVCFGRVLMRVTVDRRKILRCSNCGVEREGNDELAICCCGIKLKSKIDAGIRCIANQTRTPECPSEVVAEQVVLEEDRRAPTRRLTPHVAPEGQADLEL